MSQFATPYYNGIIKNIIVGFGALFSNIQILRTDSTGAVAQTVEVPLAYAPKEGWVVKTDQDPDLQDHVGVIIPRMSFEITGYTYDTTRMVNRNNKISYANGGTRTDVHAPVPYNIGINLYVLTKGTEDGLAIVEQILPLFTPEYTLNFIAIPAMNIKQEVPIVLNNVTVDDQYEGSFDQRRLVTHTFSFTAKANLYSGVQVAQLITAATVNADTQTGVSGAMQYKTAGNLATGSITQDVWLPKA